MIRLFAACIVPLSCLFFFLNLSARGQYTYYLRSSENHAASKPAQVVGQVSEASLPNMGNYKISIELQRGEFLEFTLIEKKMDLALGVLSPEQSQSGISSPPIGEWVSLSHGAGGFERIRLIARTTGLYRIFIGPTESMGNCFPAHFEYKINQLRPGTLRDRQLVSDDNLFRLDGPIGSPQHPRPRYLTTAQAIINVREAIVRYNQSQDLFGEKLARLALAGLHMKNQQPAKAVDEAEIALRLPPSTEMRHTNALFHHMLGRAYEAMGKFTEAERSTRRALAVWESFDDPEMISSALVNLGSYLGEQRRFPEAEQLLQRANSMWQERGSCYEKPYVRFQRSFIDHALGSLYFFRGKYQLALRHLKEVEPAIKEAEEGPGRWLMEVPLLHMEAIILKTLRQRSEAEAKLERAHVLAEKLGDKRMQGLLLLALGNVRNATQKSRVDFSRARDLFHQLMDTAGEAHTLSSLAYIEIDNDQAAAEQHFKDALSLYTTNPNLVGRAWALMGLGRLDGKQGRKRQALNRLEEAQGLFRNAGDKPGEFEALIELAALAEAQNSLDVAIEKVNEALGVIELIRSQVINERLRSSWLASLQDLYLTQAGWLMKQGRDADALTVIERGRGRLLLDELSEIGENFRADADPQMLARERDLQDRINRLMRQEFTLSSGPGREYETVGLNKEVDTLLKELSNVRAQLRLVSPRYAALTQMIPLSAERIQREVLDNQALLLEYAIGEKDAYVWAVTQTSLKGYRLTESEKIVPAINEMYSLLTARNRKYRSPEERITRVAEADKNLPAVAERLSKLLLEPVAKHLRKKKILVIADGPLTRLPFGILPEPSANIDEKPEVVTSHPLILDHTISYLPSASSLAALRLAIKGRTLASKEIAIIADPIFDRSDLRLRPGSPDSICQASSNQSKPLRLCHSGREANEIAKLYSANSIAKWTGFDATREKLLSGDISRYRLIQIVTHSKSDEENPELAALAFTQVDRSRNSINGFVRQHEIVGLRLYADVVVISACETAWGKDIPGEGLLSLGRSFIYAGAARAIASLWNVSDEATADLMIKFHQVLREEPGISPAEALAKAQRCMLKGACRSERWRSAYYWAAFVIQGEW